MQYGHVLSMKFIFSLFLCFLWTLVCSVVYVDVCSCMLCVCGLHVWHNKR